MKLLHWDIFEYFILTLLIEIWKHHSLWAEYVYNAARVLADMIDKNDQIKCQGKKCLELGAGAVSTIT